MIINIFENDDKNPVYKERAETRWKIYITIQVIISCVFVIPSLLFIRNKPKSPPSIVATKPRPNKTFFQAAKFLFKNPNYICLMVYFQLVNTVTIYGGEIQTFTEGKGLSLYQ